VERDIVANISIFIGRIVSTPGLGTRSASGEASGRFDVLLAATLVMHGHGGGAHQPKPALARRPVS